MGIGKCCCRTINWIMRGEEREREREEEVKGEREEEGGKIGTKIYQQI